jgi:hypothetical protein
MARDIKQISADLRKLIADAQDALDERTAAAIGFTVRQRMLSLISKGVSPILNAGRFPEYKNVSAKRNLQNSRRVLNRLSLSKRTNAAQIRRKSSKLSQSLKQASRGYPYSVQKDFPNKRPRPVNLFLSGDFLSNLTYALGIRGKAQVIEIGFFDDLSAKKESGHREGVNGQPKRPIIPTGSERFSAIIAQDIATIARQALNKFFRGK